MSELAVRESENIPGMYFIDLPVHGDTRGSFKEMYQKEKMEALGLPEFDIVQKNTSINEEVGVTRGIHAEPWEKYISIEYGKIFVAIVDFRKGQTFGNKEEFEMTPENAIYLPRSCGNSFQTLSELVVYSYLVNNHWSPEAQYTLVNLADPELDIHWPIALSEAIISDKDLGHPELKDIEPMEV